MTEEEINEWFEQYEERGLRLRYVGGCFEATVYDVGVSANLEIEGEGEGDSLLEAVGAAIVDFTRYSSGAV